MGLPYPRGPCDPGYYCLEGSYTSAPHAPGSPTVAEPVRSPNLTPIPSSTTNPSPTPNPNPTTAIPLRSLRSLLGARSLALAPSRSPRSLLRARFARSSQSPIGGLCPAGGYCPIGSSYPASCDSGTYNNFTGAVANVDCQACDPGMFCAGSNNPHPSGLCDPGYYCTGSATSPTQYLTPEGYYTEAGAAAPVPCNPGTFNAQTGQPACLPCLEGWYCLNQSTIVLDACPVGHYCPTGTATPVKCPQGTYSNTMQNR